MDNKILKEEYDLQRISENIFESFTKSEIKEIFEIFDVDMSRPLAGWEVELRKKRIQQERNFAPNHEILINIDEKHNNIDGGYENGGAYIPLCNLYIRYRNPNRYIQTNFEVDGFKVKDEWFLIHLKIVISEYWGSQNKSQRIDDYYKLDQFYMLSDLLKYLSSKYYNKH